MKKLTCEMCGSTDLVKQDGVFVCQSCGTKYSIEEARKMMIEGTVEVTGTVRVDSSDDKKEKINNYLEMEKSAFDCGDYLGSVNYCDKILEIDPENFEGWKRKAKSTLFSATVQDCKMGSVIVAAKRAVNIVPEAKRYEVASEIYNEFKPFVKNTILSLARNYDEVNRQLVVYWMQMWQSLLVGIPFLSKKIMEDEINDCSQLCINSKASFWDKNIYFAYYLYNHNVRFDVMFRNALADKIKLEETREKEIKEKTIKDYWNNHSDEKAALEKELSVLESQIASLKEEQKNIPEAKEVMDLQKQINDLFAEEKALGFFKKKEKKAIEEKIAAVLCSKKNATNKMNEANANIEGEIKKIQTRVDEINKELTKDR